MAASKSQDPAEHVAVVELKPCPYGEPQGEGRGGEEAPGLLSPGLRARWKGFRPRGPRGHSPRFIPKAVVSRAGQSCDARACSTCQRTKDQLGLAAGIGSRSPETGASNGGGSGPAGQAPSTVASAPGSPTPSWPARELPRTRNAQTRGGTCLWTPCILMWP